MDFFKNIKLRLLRNRLLDIIVLTFFSLLSSIAFIVSLFNKEIDLTVKIVLFALSAVLIAVLVRTVKNDEIYAELIAQTRLIGDVETIGNKLSKMEKHRWAKGILKFDRDILFFYDYLTAKIVVPSKITKISTRVSFYKINHYLVDVEYQHEKGITIEAYSKEESALLCEELKRTLAPHLLDEEADS